MENNQINDTQAPEHQPSVIQSVFRSIFIETVRDFFGSIGSFFKRYSYHYLYCIRYVWRPSLRHKNLAALDWKDNCQQTFELSLLFLFGIIFMVKLNWIPAGSKEVMDMLSNDLHQMGVELFLFFGFAITYVVAVVLSILVGRLLRRLFEVPLNQRENDILFTYLNNVVISFVLVLSFVFRCSFSLLSLGEEGEDTMVGVWAVLFLLLLPVVLIWSIRFCKTNGMETGKNVLFTTLCLFPLVFFYSYCGYFMTILLFTI